MILRPSACSITNIFCCFSSWDDSECTYVQSSIMFDIWVHLQHKKCFSPLERCMVLEDSGSRDFTPPSFEPRLVLCCRITATASYLLCMLPAVPQVVWAVVCFYQHFLLLAYPHQFFPLLKAFCKSSVWSKLSQVSQVH